MDRMAVEDMLQIDSIWYIALTTTIRVFSLSSASLDLAAEWERISQ